MKQRKAVLALTCVVASLLGSATQAQGQGRGRVDFGQREYVSSCASCHGESGRGDGVLKLYLVKAPSDLTTLSKRNGGVFPSQRVWDTIDGRTSTDIGPHGAREMPVWGDIYRSEDTHPRDLHARIRISSLLDYLARLQEK